MALLEQFNTYPGIGSQLTRQFLIETVLDPETAPESATKMRLALA
jgi:hypothetical protein